MIALDDVDAAGVGARYKAALLEDEMEQRIELALRRDRLRYLDELTELVAIAVQPFASALGARLGVEQLGGAVNGEQQLVVAGLRAQDRSEAVVLRLGEIDRSGTPQE